MFKPYELPLNNAIYSKTRKSLVFTPAVGESWVEAPITFAVNFGPAPGNIHPYLTTRGPPSSLASLQPFQSFFVSSFFFVFFFRMLASHHMAWGSYSCYYQRAGNLFFFPKRANFRFLYRRTTKCEANSRRAFLRPKCRK